MTWGLEPDVASGRIVSGMTKRPAPRPGWSVGELAQATGLTVRTLHHYEHIGLLSPRARTEGRHRLYDAGDVRRLYQVCALRDIGVPLAEIRRVLDDKPRLVEVLRTHALRVDAEIARLRRLQMLLRHASKQASRVRPDDLLATIEAMATVSRRADVVKATRTASEGREARWRELGTQLRACMKRRAAPSSPRVLELARRAKAYIDEFAGGDGATIAALAHLRRVAPPKSLAGWTPALMGYLDQALVALSWERS